MTPHIAVAGGGVAGLAAARAALFAGADVTLLEASPRVGGLLETELLDDGTVIEHGPDSLATSKPAGLRAVEELGLSPDLLRGSGKGAFVLSGGALHPMPTGWLAMSPAVGREMLTSSIFSLAGKMRLAMEPFVRTKEGDADESVASFFRRRFGSEIADRLVAPMLGEIYASDTEALSIRAVMPRLAEMERHHGSVARALARTVRVPRSETTTRPLSPLMTLRRGLGSLTDAMGDALGVRVTTSAPVRSIARTGRRFELQIEDGSVVCADGVILALPPWYAAPVVERFDPELAAQLGNIRAARFDTFTATWPRSEIPHALDGTGFVVAPGEERAIRACSWSSEKWPDRAPSGTLLLRVILRTDDPLSERDVEDVARCELRDLMGIETPPSLVRIRQLPRALPHYEIGHIERAARASDRALERGPLALAGHGVGGLGIPECVASGERAASLVLESLSSRGRSRP